MNVLGAVQILELLRGVRVSSAEVSYITTGAAVYFAVRILDRPSFRWNMDNLEKGVDAETRVGQIIEYAITAENCAVAHSVTMIARVGDIDPLSPHP